MLKQGLGRLIRTATDRGVLAILDSRLTTKGYGKRFLSSLPSARQVTSIEQVRTFFHSDF
jgi:ATP-dependent DNA helicase DinG